MTTYYVRVTGSDAAAGTSAGAAWLTIGYAMTHVSAGDTIYVGGGTYRISAAIAPSSMASMTYLYGDVDGAYTGDAGEVIVTAYGTNDTTVPANVRVFDLSSKNFWTLAKVTAIGAVSQNGIHIASGSHDITLQDCTVYAQLGQGILIGPSWSTVANVLVERCRVMGANAIGIICPANASGVDYSLGINIRNSILRGPVGGGYGVSITGSNNTAKSGGITVANCHLEGTYGIRQATASGTSVTYPIAAYNNLILATVGLGAATAGQIVSDYNVIAAGTALTNVTQGAHDIIDGSRMWRFSFGHEASYGGTTRPFGEPPVGSPLLTFGSYAGNTLDMTGAPRPGSGASSVAGAVGAFERSNSGTRSATQHATTDSLAITGPGYHDFDLQVAATATSVKLWVRWDATYAGTKPSISVRNGGQCGVAAATATATGTATNWEQLTLTFTPTATGIVTIRLTSSDTNGAGVTLFGDRTVA